MQTVMQRDIYVVECVLGTSSLATTMPYIELLHLLHESGLAYKVQKDAQSVAIDVHGPSQDFQLKLSRVH